MKEPVRWTSGISFVVLGVILSVVGISVVRFTEARAEPWLYLTLVIGMSALGGLVITVIRAKQWSN